MPLGVVRVRSIMWGCAQDDLFRTISAGVPNLMIAMAISDPVSGQRALLPEAQGYEPPLPPY